MKKVKVEASYSFLFRERFYPVLYYIEHSKIHLRFCKVKFFQVEHNAIVIAVSNIVHCVPKWYFYGVITEYAIINKSGFSDRIDSYIVELTSIYIYRHMESKWDPKVLISTPFSDECSYVTCSWGEGKAMIPIPSIQDSFLHVYWHHRGLIKQRWGILGLPHGSSIELLQVYHAPGWAVLF